LKRPELFAWRLGKYASQARRTLATSQYEFQVALDKTPENLEILTKKAVGRELELVNILEAAQQFSTAQGLKIEQVPRNNNAYALLMKRGGLTPDEIREQLALREQQASVLERNVENCRSVLEKISLSLPDYFELSYQGFSWICEEKPHEILIRLGKNVSDVLELGRPFLAALEQRRSVESIDMALNQWDKVVEELLQNKET
jgi:uncharacterized protein YnzC (UPF0291/DUF896 family)